MMNAELIKALQTDIREVEDDPVKTLSLMWLAADALEAAEAWEKACTQKCERLEKRIAELSLDNKMLKNMIDADKGVMLDRIRFLEAQLPKEGEWEHMPNSYVCVCTACSKYWIPDGDEYDYHYCPNCGARMTKGEQE